MSLERSLELPRPELELLFSAELEMGVEYDMGQTPEGKYEVYSFSSGVFHGNTMSGTVLDCGGSWRTTRPDGVVTTNSKYMLKTDDGDVIMIESSGASLDKPAKSISERLFIKTGARKYTWLNDTVTIGFIKPMSSHRIVLEAFAVK